MVASLEESLMLLTGDESIPKQRPQWVVSGHSE